MATITPVLLLPSILKEIPSRERSMRSTNKNKSIVPVARLFGPATFEASKLNVLYLGVDEQRHPSTLPRAYTLTHNDITSNLTLAISQTINNCQLQGWYNRLQRDEVVAEWKKIKGNMSLHVHCHVSGGHFMLDLCARLRYYIFCKELPMVLHAFVRGDENLFKHYPELQEAMVWVYFHSNIPEFNKVECWGPLKGAVLPSDGTHRVGSSSVVSNQLSADIHLPCQGGCDCCSAPLSLIPWTHDRRSNNQDQNLLE